MLFLSTLCAFICLSQMLNAQISTGEKRFKQITTEHGLPSTNLRYQTQDEQGLMWFCVEAEGLCMYDGYNFTLFNNIPDNPLTISSNYPNMAQLDLDGNIWIATDNGLNKLNTRTRTFQQFYFDSLNKTSIPDNMCLSVFCDSEGTIWVGTINGIARKAPNSDSFTRYFNSPEDSSSFNNISVNRFIEYPRGTIWMATHNGIIKLNKQTGQYQHINAPVKYDTDNSVIDILPLNNCLWIATLQGLFTMDTETLKFKEFEYLEQHKPLIKNEGFATLMYDSKGQIWAGSFTKGLLIIDPYKNNYEWISASNYGLNPLRSNHIRHIYEDSMGLIWIGTKFGGVFQYNENQNIFNNWPKAHKHLYPYQNEYLLSISIDSNKNYWLGTKYHGLINIDSETGEATSYTQNSQSNRILNSNRVEHVLYDNNYIWIATSLGINLLNTNNKHISSIANVHTNYLFKDKSGRLWAATKSGIKIIEKIENNYVVVSPDYDESFFNAHYDVLQILEDSKGTLWFSTRHNGLHTLNPATGDYFKYQINPKVNQTRSIFEDEQKRIWVSSKSNGVFLLNQNKNEHLKFDTQNGLAGNMVMSIEQDSDGNLWFGTNNGISRLNMSDTTFSNFNSDLGLLSNIAELNASFKFDSGDLLFSGNNGFNVFNPETIEQQNQLPELIITSFKVNYREILFDEAFSNAFIFSFRDNYISFEFTLADYHSPHTHQYTVMLEGVDNQWSQPTNRNYVSYTNLAPGNYTLWVKGTNRLHNKPHEAVSINFSILKPFYQKTWFRTATILLIFIMIALIMIQVNKRQSKLEKQINERTHKLEIAYRELLNKNTKIREQNRQIEKQQANLEEKVKERTRDLEIAKRKAEESDKLKSSFLANMSHEIRTPLNAISGFSALITSDIYSNERKEKFAGIIKSNIESLLKLVEDILEISKIEAGQVTIEKKYSNIDSMLIHITKLHKEELFQARGNKVVLNYNNPNRNTIEFNCDTIRVKQILSNLLSNAIKFTNEGTIELSFKTNKNSITFWVKDTGIGIKKENIESIFNRFTKIEDNNPTFRGTGIGLSISKSLTHIMGGQIWVESEINKGSVFYVDIPGEVKVNHTNTSRKKSKPESIRLENKTILVIEYEKSNYVLIQSYLSDTKAKTIWAKDSASGIQFCKQQHFDLILLDIRLPDIDGYETCKRMREIAPSIPVIAQTAYAAQEDKIRLSAAGFASFLIKPFSREELLEKISLALSNA